MDNRYSEDFRAFGISKEREEAVWNAWNEQHRVYHDAGHLCNILDLIDASDSDADIKRKHRIMAFYHDLHYNIYRNDNELMSANSFVNDVESDPNGKCYFSDAEVTEIYEGIKDTANHALVPTSTLSAQFLRYDVHNLLYGKLPALIEDGRKMTREYGVYDWTLMQAGRIAAMEKIKPWLLSVNPDSRIGWYIEWLQGYTPNIACFPGTFFEYTTGHDDIMKRAEKIFDKVILCPGNNPLKDGNKEKMDYVETTLRKLLPNNQIEPFIGMLSHYVNSKPYPMKVVKGLRNVTDFESNRIEEIVIGETNTHNGIGKGKDLDICYIISSAKMAHVSSSLIRTLDAIQATEPRREDGFKYSDEYRYTNKHLHNNIY